MVLQNNDFPMFFRNFNDKTLDVKKLTEKLKRNEPPGPPFKPLNNYVDDEIIYEISLLFVILIEKSLEKSGYVIIKEKKDELIEKFYVSITSWGKESNYFFRCIDSKEFTCKTFFRKILPFFRNNIIIISDFSTIIESVLKQLDFPQLKKWLDNEYLPNKKYNEYRINADYEISKFLIERKLESHRNVSSSPITCR